MCSKRELWYRPSLFNLDSISFTLSKSPNSTAMLDITSISLQSSITHFHPYVLILSLVTLYQHVPSLTDLLPSLPEVFSCFHYMLLFTSQLRVKCFTYLATQRDVKSECCLAWQKEIDKMTGMSEWKSYVGMKCRVCI